MRAYSEVYLSEFVENQGKLFDLISEEYSYKDTENFIESDIGMTLENKLGITDLLWNEAQLRILRSNILKQVLTDKIDDLEVYMKGIDHSYYYEGFYMVRTADL